MVSVMMFADDSVLEMPSLACPSYCQLLTVFALIKKPTFRIRHHFDIIHETTEESRLCF